MRRILLLAAFFALGTSICQAQDSSEEKFKLKHEVKLNLIYPLAEIIELNYDLIINEDFSVGLGLNYWFDSDAIIDYQILPYFRFYPLEQKPGAGFFIEANTSILSLTTDYYDVSFHSDPVQEETSTVFGMGVATGFKFLSKGNFVTELYGGAGRVIGEDDTQFYPRFGITLGKRF